MIVLYTHKSLSSDPFNYYGSLALRKKALTVTDGGFINLYDSLENVVDYSKSVALTDFKNNASIFEDLKEGLTDISFVSYLKKGNLYLSYDQDNNSLELKEYSSKNELTENEYFEFVLSGEDFFIKKTINTNTSGLLSS